MRIGRLLSMESSVESLVAQVVEIEKAGYDHAWATQIFGPDALTALAVAGAATSRVGLGTAVVPIYPRHPQMLAQQA
ncbi:MAG: LLM class flavin-dependent oxidoreductase, partial [Actinobacteria bacterium]|nr:LLM class flavin-dependent oxidoreductase [Actinomycetota bacterium]